MIRIEFNTYDDGTYYFLYVSEEVRIETNGSDGLQMETRDSRVRDLGDPFRYLTIKQRKDEYFNESLINPYIDMVIKAAEIIFYTI
jgi:fructose-specific phosphotransferase system component IIB